MGLLSDKKVTVVHALSAVTVTSIVVALGGLMGVTIRAYNFIDRAIIAVLRLVLS